MRHTPLVAVQVHPSQPLRTPRPVHPLRQRCLRYFSGEPAACTAPQAASARQQAHSSARGAMTGLWLPLGVKWTPRHCQHAMRAAQGR